MAMRRRTAEGRAGRGAGGARAAYLQAAELEPEAATEACSETANKIPPFQTRAN